MRFYNALIFQGQSGFFPGSFRVENGTFTDVTYTWEAGGDDGGLDENGLRIRKKPRKIYFTSSGRVPLSGSGEGIDLHDALVIPGLIDIHTHGNSGCDFSDGEEEGLHRMGRYLAAHGITAFAPTSMTLPYDRLSAAFRTAAAYRVDRAADEARMAGINMEGPFFSREKRGAQNPEYLRLPDLQAFQRLQEDCGGLIRIADIAPELPGALDFIRTAASCCRISAAHTTASYEEAAAAFEAGARHVTHLFNAMPPLHHRDPGVIGAAADRKDVTAELICDGHHVHPAMVRLAFRLFPGRICLISDALRCCGMPDGRYDLGGQEVNLSGGVARLADGTIAGAASHLFEDMKKAISFGIPASDAIEAATIRPAEVLGCEGELGSIREGKTADFLVCSRNLELLHVYLGGKEIKTIDMK